MVKGISLLMLTLSLVGISSSASAFEATAKKEVVGIGVNADLVNAHLMVVSLIAGAPAEKSGVLQVNDEILAVQSTPSAAFVAVAGKTMDEVGALFMVTRVCRLAYN